MKIQETYDSDKEDIEPLPNLPSFLIEDQEQQDVNTLYKYRDFGQVKEDDDDVQEIPAPTPSSRGSTESSIRVQKFPVKLYAILAQKEFQGIISWMPHGRSWKVLKPTMFETLVMPLFFEYSNYHSFNRLVNAWSFRRISAGPDRGSYYHELFLRGKPFLQKYMRRLPKTHKKLPMKKKDEPDFYKLDKSNRLPALQDAPIPGAAAASIALRQQQQQQSQQNTPSLPVVTQQHQSQSPVTTSTVVTPPSLSPSIMNMSGMNQGSNMLRSNSGFNMDLMAGHNEGMMNNMGMMGLTGMGQNRLNNDLSRLNNDLGPMPSRFNGYNATNNDLFDLQDEYDLQQFGLNGGRMMGNGMMGNGMGAQSLSMNNDLGFPSLANGFNSGLLGGYGDVSNQGRFGGIHSNPSQIRRSVASQMRQQIPSMDMMSNISSNDGLGRSNALDNVQDFYPSQYSQQQQQNFDQLNSFTGLNQGVSPQRLNQFQQYQDGSRSSSLQAQQVNSMGSSMQMLRNSMGMNPMVHEDYMSSGMRRSTSRV